MKILLEIPIGMSGGYTKDGIGLTRALIDRGHQVILRPLGLQVPLPVDIANLLSVDHYQPPPYDLRITHQSPLDVALSAEDASKATANIYWTMWEWENYPWEMAERLTWGTQHYDYFVAYDSGSLASLSPHIAIPDDHKFEVQGGYESEDWKVSWKSKDPSKTFVFGAVGDLSARKNPVAMINAYRMFKDRNPDADVALFLKSRQPFRGHALGSFRDPEYNIVEINEVWTRDQMEEFYYGLGAYIAPSYGEGKNLPALEAATCGLPLILSDIPGHRAWASGMSSVKFVGGERSGLRMQGIPMYGLKVDEEELSYAMEEVYDQKNYYWDEARSNVLSVVSSMDWTKAVERLGNRLGIPWL